jgi:hypothetical protein
VAGILSLPGQHVYFCYTNITNEIQNRPQNVQFSESNDLSTENQLTRHTERPSWVYLLPEKFSAPQNGSGTTVWEPLLFAIKKPE